MGKKHFCFFQTAETGNRTPNSGVKGRGANHYPRAPAQTYHQQQQQRICAYDETSYIYAFHYFSQKVKQNNEHKRFHWNAELWMQKLIPYLYSLRAFILKSDKTN